MFGRRAPPLLSFPLPGGETSPLSSPQHATGYPSGRVHESRGERGGLRFTHDVAHLDTHSFTHLVKVGWIGSQGSMSDEVGAIIREKLNPKRHHSVIIAALSQETAGQQHMQFEPLIQ